MPELTDQSLIDHLEALRKTLLKIITITVVIFPLAYWCTPMVIEFLVHWCCPPEMGELHYFSPMEVFIARLKLALAIALIVSFPFNAWQLWRFLLPALYESERKSLKWWISSSTLLFIAGAGFCMATILPILMRFSASFTTNHLKPVIGLANFLGLAGWLTLAFGLMFQFPLAVILSVRFRLIRVETMRKGRPYILTGILILAALLTPPDIVSQLFLATPTWLLFELGLLVASHHSTKPKTNTAENQGNS